jgi:hypothetical protein
VHQDVSKKRPKPPIAMLDIPFCFASKLFSSKRCASKCYVSKNFASKRFSKRSGVNAM